MMTIDEAIAHAREVAEEQRVKNRTCGNCKYCKKGQIHPRQGYCYFNAIHYEHDLSQKACSNWESNDDIGCQCAEEHEQLVKWLEELKTLRAEIAEMHDERQAEIALKKEHDEQIRANAIDEAIKKLAESEDTILSDRQYYILMELKDSK